MLLLYARVSTAEQATDDKTSLAEQNRIGRGFAMAKGFSQFDVSSYEDAGVSASIPLKERPGGGRLLQDMKTGDVVFASKLDRMFRSARDALNMAEIFKERKINLVLFNFGTEPVNGTGIGEFFFTMMAAVAQLERVQISERMNEGKKAKVAKGGHAGGRAPFGFRIVGKGRDARLERVEEEQRVIEAVEDRMNREPYPTLQQFCWYLENNDMLARNGQPFFPMQVKRIIDQVKRAAH